MRDGKVKGGEKMNILIPILFDTIKMKENMICIYKYIYFLCLIGRWKGKKISYD